MAVHIKAYLNAGTEEEEIRRFSADEGAATSFLWLQEKIKSLFPPIQGREVEISWHDEDGEVVRLSSDEELTMALCSKADDVLYVYVKMANDGDQEDDEAPEDTGRGLGPWGRARGMRRNTMCPRGGMFGCFPRRGGMFGPGGPVLGGPRVGMMGGRAGMHGPRDGMMAGRGGPRVGMMGGRGGPRVGMMAGRGGPRVGMMGGRRGMHGLRIGMMEGRDGGCCMAGPRRGMMGCRGGPRGRLMGCHSGRGINCGPCDGMGPSGPMFDICMGGRGHRGHMADPRDGGMGPRGVVMGCDWAMGAPLRVM
ncbi:predicted protein [Nematostella vectensis]|uniref:PB1 domain-containing protein n=1 Tax=Nematostella vectensis TaxID=45351 RepID=A7SCD6_NEMVE|nr:predicted protein [Nematostella vectensis]|eukprot:XP_001630703.1 predicted protein [Nematostella vectensis]